MIVTRGVEVVESEIPRKPKPADREMLLLTMNFYRDAELRGARLLMNLHRHLLDGDSQMKLSRHLADEVRHAWLWTERIGELGGMPIAIDSGYQRRMGQRAGVPRDVTELLALTLVAERRAIDRYREHASRPGVDEGTLAVLNSVTADEQWHLDWVEAKLRALSEHRGGAKYVANLVERYEAIDREVYASLQADEARWADEQRRQSL